MSERELLERTANALFTDHCSVERVEGAVDAGWDPRLWQALVTTGFTELSLMEGTLADAATVIRLGAYHSAMAPLGETLFLGGWLQQQLGLPITAPVTAGFRTDRVPYGRVAEALVVDPSSGEVARAELAEVGHNVAREPRDRMRPIGESIGQLDAEATEELVLRAGLLRTIQLAGAAQRALDLTVTYATERVQFGRTISKFQAVQQAVAVMAAEVAVIRASADAAVDAGERDGIIGAAFAIAAAKTQASQAAGSVARIAHQMHGAIGFTHEHSLRLSTTRLWSWRDEAGNEGHWSGVVGAAVRNAGGAGLWPLIVGS